MERTDKQIRSANKNLEKARAKRITHGLHRLRRLGSAKWPPVARRAYAAIVADLEAMDHLTPRHKLLVRAIAEVSVLTQIAMDHMISGGVANQDGFLKLSSELRGWYNTQARYLQIAGLTPVSTQRVMATAESISEWLAKVDAVDAETEAVPSEKS